MKKSITILILVLVIVVISLSIERTGVINMNIKVDDLKREYDILYNENKTLRTEITSIIAIEKLYKIAENKKYVSPKKEDIIYLSND